ncbi:MAG: HigA family addiction module antitoxin [Candidatus Omnitrophica bacterium]|nr:HigA family addiction module antitoxin [Candidatus Omnitrophota bacterium]
MYNTKKYKFNPDYAVAPGETVLEYLNHLGMTQAELSTRTGRPLKTINEIIKGKQAITPETALQFERALGMTASFWNNLEKNYREVLVGNRETRLLGNHLEWLNKIPVNGMIANEWIKKCDNPVYQLQEVLSFFGVASPRELSANCSQVVYRQSKKLRGDPWAICAWLREGELVAQAITCDAYDSAKFRAALNTIRGMTVEPISDVLVKWQSLCAECGIALVLVKELPNLKVNGATRWISKDKAVIQLSLLYKFADIFWFTFFHEAGHILLHGKKEVFIESHGKENNNEKEADEFAENILIPKREYSTFINADSFTYEDIIKFSKKIDISPGIILGRLQFEKRVPYNSFSSLKQRFCWK